MHIHTHTYTHTHIHAHIHTHTHTCTHMHTSYKELTASLAATLKLWPAYVYWARGQLKLAADAFVAAVDSFTNGKWCFSNSLPITKPFCCTTLSECSLHACCLLLDLQSITFTKLILSPGQSSSKSGLVSTVCACAKYPMKSWVLYYVWILLVYCSVTCLLMYPYHKS